MKHKFAEFSCIALLWIGTAGMFATMYASRDHLQQIRSASAFAAVIAMGCIAKLLLDGVARGPRNLNDA